MLLKHRSYGSQLLGVFFCGVTFFSFLYFSRCFMFDSSAFSDSHQMGILPCPTWVCGVKHKIETWLIALIVALSIRHSLVEDCVVFHTCNKGDFWKQETLNIKIISPTPGVTRAVCSWSTNQKCRLTTRDIWATTATPCCDTTRGAVNWTISLWDWRFLTLLWHFGIAFDP